MRFVGQSEVAAFLRDHHLESERLQSWVAEMRHRHWRSPQHLTTAFRDVDVSHLPTALFRFDRPRMHIETLIDFRTSVIVLVAIKYPQSDRVHLQHGNRRLDH